MLAFVTAGLQECVNHKIWANSIMFRIIELSIRASMKVVGSHKVALIAFFAALELNNLRFKNLRIEIMLFYR